MVQVVKTVVCRTWVLCRMVTTAIDTIAQCLHVLLVVLVFLVMLGKFFDETSVHGFQTGRWRGLPVVKPILQTILKLMTHVAQWSIHVLSKA